MKVLINNNFKALRHGEFVSANQEAGEFVLDTANAEEMTVATLHEVCLANKIEFGKKDKKSDLLSKIETGLIELKLPEQNKMSETQKVKEIIIAGVAANKTDDEMLIEIVTSGIPFKLAGRLFKKEMEEGGYRVNANKVKAAIKEILENENFKPETPSEVQAMITAIVKGRNAVEETDDEEAVSEIVAVQGADDDLVLKAIRSYCKEKEIEMPKAPKAAKGEGSSSGARAQIMKFMKENPSATDEQIVTFLNQFGRSEESKKKTVEFFANVAKFGREMYELGRASNE